MLGSEILFSILGCEVCSLLNSGIQGVPESIGVKNGRRSISVCLIISD